MAFNNISPPHRSSATNMAAVPRGMGSSAGSLILIGPLLLILCLHILIVPSANSLGSSSSSSTNPDDVLAMQAIALYLNPLPPRWRTGFNADPCGGRWMGVTCDVAGRVTAIDLHGTILIGQLPPEVANLSSLQALNLQNNLFGGDLPSLAGLTNLRELHLGENGFRSIPTDFFSGLTSLVNVSLDHIPLAPWVLPNDLGGKCYCCSNLVRFNAVNSNLGGAIPDFFNGLPALQYLMLSHNHMAGALPPSMGNSSIRELHLDLNQLRLIRSSTTRGGGNNSGLRGKLSAAGTSLDVLDSMTQLSVLTICFRGP